RPASQRVSILCSTCGNEGSASIRCSHVYVARGKRGKFHTASGEGGRSGVIILGANSKSRQGAFAALAGGALPLSRTALLLLYAERIEREISALDIALSG